MSTHAPFDLEASARQSMIEHGFEPEYPAAVKQELSALEAKPPQTMAGLEDLRGLLWSSIDNDTSRDLDQIEYADRLPDGSTRVRIGIADVDAYVPKGSAIDKHAAVETVTVYTGVKNFSMLPEELSTGLTSLNENEDRLAIVTEFVVAADGSVGEGCVYRALVRNRAQAGPPHQCVRPALDHLIEGGCATGDEPGAGNGEDHPGGIGNLSAAHDVAGERRSHDQHVQARLRERDEVVGAAARCGERDSVSTGLHAAEPFPTALRALALDSPACPSGRRPLVTGDDPPAKRGAPSSGTRDPAVIIPL